MRTTAQLKQDLAHYQIAIEVITICQQLAPSLENKMMNKRITDKFAAAIVEQSQLLKKEGKTNVFVTNTGNGLDVKINYSYDYQKGFTIVIRGPYSYGTQKEIIYNSGRLDASTLAEFCQHSAKMYAGHIEDTQKAIAAMPAAVAFLQSVVETCDKMDKTQKLYTGLLCHTSDIREFLQRETGQE